MIKDRRVPFFLVAAVISALLYFPSPEQFRWVTLALAGVYVGLAVFAALDHWSERRR